MHLKRVLTAITILPILLFIIIKSPPIVFAIVIAVVNLIAYFEYSKIASEFSYITDTKIVFLIGLIVSIFIIFFNHFNLYHLTCYTLILNFIFLFIFSLKKSVEHKIFKKQFFGLIYISCSLSCAILIKNNISDGINWLIFTLFLVMASDTGAYYVGSKFGKHKLTSISPNKTIEGFLGGIVLLFIIGFIFKNFFFPYLNFKLAIVFFIIISFIAPCGDIFESSIKRKAKIKDTGTILPGHGGVLDRIDSLLFVLPVSYLFRLCFF